MNPRFEAIYTSIKKRVDYHRWGRISKYTIVRGCKVPGLLFIAVRLGHGVTVVEANHKANWYTVNGLNVTLDVACKLLEHASKEIERYKDKNRRSKKPAVRKPVKLDDAEFHRQKDLESKISLSNRVSINARIG